MFNLKQFRLVHTAAVAFGAVALAGPAAHAMPIDPVSPSASGPQAGVAVQHIGTEATVVKGPRLTPFGGSDASQIAPCPVPFAETGNKLGEGTSTAGLYSSASAVGLPKLLPPASKTLPVLSSVAVCRERAAVIARAGVNAPVAPL